MHLFLGRGVKKAKHSVHIKKEKQENETKDEDDSIEDGVFGRVPQALLEEELANLEILLRTHSDLVIVLVKNILCFFCIYMCVCVFLFVFFVFFSGERVY